MSDKMRDAFCKMIEQAHREGQKSAAGREGTGHRWETSESCRNIGEMFAALTQQPDSDPEFKSIEPGFTGWYEESKYWGRVKSGTLAAMKATWKAAVASRPQPSAQVPERILELAGRLVASGPKCCAVSASECHEITDFIHSLSADPSVAEKREWISCEDQLPTEEDADFNGDVIWWAPALNFPMVRGWDNSAYKNFSPFWMPTGLQRPQPPEGE